MNIQHSSRQDNWGTPFKILQIVNRVLGSIDLDPASSNDANEIICASKIFTEESDGLSSIWGLNDSVFINPPSGKVGKQSKTLLFWKKLMHELYCGNVGHAIFLAFSVEQMQSSQNKGVPPMLAYPFCVPSKRISFIDPNKTGRNAPSHSNMIIYVPGSIDVTYRFKEHFSSIGYVRE
jgi:hypothetical protein